MNLTPSNPRYSEKKKLIYQNPHNPYTVQIHTCVLNIRGARIYLKTETNTLKYKRTNLQISCTVLTVTYLKRSLP